jgi:uracil-DNA glycosylase
MRRQQKTRQTLVRWVFLFLIVVSENYLLGRSLIMRSVASLHSLSAINMRYTQLQSTFTQSYSVSSYSSHADKALARLSRYHNSHATTRSQSHYSTFRRSRITMMPEGPEVRSLVDRLQGGVGRSVRKLEIFSGRYAQARPSATNKDWAPRTEPKGYSRFQQLLTQSSQEDSPINLVIHQWSCKGKFIYIILKPDPQTNDLPHCSIWITLGLTGRLVNEEAHLNDSRFSRWFLELVSTKDSKKIYYQDMRNFGTLAFCFDEDDLVDKLARLGPDILYMSYEDFDNVYKNTRVTTNICQFLMNQAKIAGIGNYILSEGLHRACIDPFASLSELAGQQRRDLFDAMQSVARESYESQRPRNLAVDGPAPEFEMRCYGLKTTTRSSKSGESTSSSGSESGQEDKTTQIDGRYQVLVVRKETPGPHGRSIYYTDDQLFMSRAERIHREQEQLLLSQQSLVSSDPTLLSATDLPQIQTAEAIDVSYTPTAMAMPPQTNNDKPKAASPRRTSKHLEEKHSQVEIVVDNHVKELLSGLTDESWRTKLDPFLQSETFYNLASFIEQEKSSGAIIYPPTYAEVFAVLNACPWDKVKVVVVGQDPYHGQGQAHGFAFSVNKGVPIPPSLKNIFREIQNDPVLSRQGQKASMPRHGNLMTWVEQGVLLLNTVLTVQQGVANSHARRGWEDFTDEVIRVLNEERADGLVFLLWGAPAAKKAARVDENVHTVIRTSHPSPLGATKTASPFLGSQCFSRCNEALVEMGKEPIDWTIL